MNDKAPNARTIVASVSPITDDFTALDQQYEAELEATIDGDSDAEEHSRCYKYWREQYSDAAQRFDNEIARLMARSDTVLNRIQRREEWHYVALNSYYRSKGEKRVVLANATLSNIKGRDRVEVNDMDALILWTTIENVGGLLREKVEPDKAAIQAYIKKTGEIPPGTNLVHGDDNLKVKF